MSLALSVETTDESQYNVTVETPEDGNTKIAIGQSLINLLSRSKLDIRNPDFLD